MMSFEEFQVGALNLGYSLSLDKHDVYCFEIDNVGIIYTNGKYLPYGWALCRYWSDELILEHMRAAVLTCRSAEMALDYLELLSTLERYVAKTL